MRHLLILGVVVFDLLALRFGSDSRDGIADHEWHRRGTWWSVTFYVPTRLVVAIRQLEAAHAALRGRAVVRERLRIDEELRRDLGRAPADIADEGRHVIRAVDGDAAGTAADVDRLVLRSRNALAASRRLVRAYQEASSRTELQAGIALLEAAGTAVCLQVLDARVVDAQDEQSRTAVRAAIVAALREPGALRQVVIRVDRDPAANLRVTIAPPIASSSEVGVAAP